MTSKVVHTVLYGFCRTQVSSRLPFSWKIGIIAASSMTFLLQSSVSRDTDRRYGSENARLVN